VQGELHFSHTIEEKMSLSDRFGLCLSFYSINQDEYLAIVDNYFSDAIADRDALHKLALRFALQKGGRSGRTAKQFYNSYYGKQM
jgi:predicted AAA+ superfamily ATPase